MGNLQALLELTDSLDDYDIINSSIAIHRPKTQYGNKEETGTFVTDLVDLEINVPVVTGYSIESADSDELGAILVVKAVDSNALGIKVRENYDYIIVFDGMAYCRLISELQFMGYKAKNISISATGKVVHTLVINDRRFVISGVYPEYKLKEIK